MCPYSSHEVVDPSIHPGDLVGELDLLIAAEGGLPLAEGHLPPLVLLGIGNGGQLVVEAVLSVQRLFSFPFFASQRRKMVWGSGEERLHVAIN